MLRRTAVAGVFYPDRPAAVEAEVSRLMADVTPRLAAAAIVVPHAGWKYSGGVAGAVYARVIVPRLAIILGPNHTGRGSAGSIMCRGRWALPGAEVPIAEELAYRILSASAVLEDDEIAHRGEHAIEVQLPFLRRVRPDLEFVPIALQRDDLGFCRDVGHAIATVIGTLAEPALLVCSTDLNHYESQAASNRKDRLAIAAILTLEPERLRAVVREHEISMCGLAPALATLAALRELGQARAELVRYQTSGDVTGDFERVVGYAGLIMSRGPR